MRSKVGLISAGEGGKGGLWLGVGRAIERGALFVFLTDASALMRGQVRGRGVAGSFEGCEDEGS